MKQKNIARYLLPVFVWQIAFLCSFVFFTESNYSSNNFSKKEIENSSSKDQFSEVSINELADVYQIQEVLEEELEIPSDQGTITNFKGIDSSSKFQNKEPLFHLKVPFSPPEC